MGLFGDQDAHDVSDNPFYVAPGNYQSILTEFALRSTDKSGTTRYGVSFNWTVDETDNEYDGSRLSEWINVHFDEDGDANAIKRDRARLKSRLQAIGMTPDEMNDILVENDGVYSLDETIAEKYIGLVAFLQVTETKDKNFDTNGKIYTNIAKVELPS